MKKTVSLLVGLAMLSLANFGSAQTLYWDGGTVNIVTTGDGISQGTNGTWNGTLQNWDQGSGLAHAAWTGGADAVFGATGIATNAGYGLVTLGSALTANSLTVTSTNYVFSDGGTAANTLAVSSVSNLFGVVINANIVNAAGFTLAGSNTLTIVSNSPGFTGPVTIASGTLRFGDNSANNGPTSFGNVAIATNATLSLRDATSAAYSQTISGDGSVSILNKNSGVTTTNSGANTYNGRTIIAQATLAASSIDESGPNNLGYGPLQIGDTVNSAVGFNYIFPGGDVTTSRPLIFGQAGVSIANNSAGILTLNGPVSYSTGATLAKSITLNGSIFAVFASSIPDNITLTATNLTTLAKGGANTWLLTGSNTFSGGVAFGGGSTGVLLITNDAAFGAVTGGITHSTNGSASASGGEIDSTNAPVILAATRKITFVGVNAGGTPTAKFKTTDANSLTVASYITGVGNVNKVSSSYANGPVRFSNDTNDFTGNFSTGYGNTEFTSVANSGTASSLGKGVTNSGTITIGNSSSVATFKYVGSASSSTTRPLNWTGTTGFLTLDASGGGTVQYLATASLKSGSGSAGLGLQGTNTGNNTLAQVINDSGGTTTLFKSGAGKWVLTAVNTYGGATTISGGTLSVSADGNLGTAPVSATPNSLTINGGALAASAGFALNANRGIALGPTGTNSLGNPATGSGTIDVAASQTLTYAGIMADQTATNSGSLVKTGAGQLTLSGANTYTGNTTVSGGTLALTGSGTIGGGTNLSIAAGATFDVTGTAGFTLAAGQVLEATNGATATLAGNVNASAGALVIGYTNGTPTINVTNGTLMLAAAMTATVNIENGGVPLPPGKYRLISKATGGLVSGVAPATSIVFGGVGVVTNTAALVILTNELYLNVPAAVSLGTTTTAVALTSGANPAVFGSPLTFTATVTGSGGSATPGGSVTFSNGVTLLGTGILSGSGTTATATLTTSGLPAGTNSITADYAGDANYTGSLSGALPQVVKYNPPVVTGIIHSGTGVVLSFTGTNGQPYQILTSTNVVTPVTNWTAAASGTFAGTTVSYTNPAASDPKRFYLLTTP